MPAVVIDIRSFVYCPKDDGQYRVSLSDGTNSVTVSGADYLTDDRRLALTAAKAGLSILRRGCSVNFYSPSKYLVSGAAAFFQTSAWNYGLTEKMRNEVLWSDLFEIASRHSITWHLATKQTSTVSGYTHGERSDADYRYTGLIAPWSIELGPYRAFDEQEQSAELICSQSTSTNKQPNIICTTTKPAPYVRSRSPGFLSNPET